LRAESNLGLLVLSVLALLVVLFAPEQMFNRIRQIKNAGGGWVSYNGLRVALELLLFLLAVVSVAFIVDYGKMVGRWFSIGAVSGITFFRIIGYYIVHYQAKWRERKLRKWAKLKSQRRQRP
jgi:hypothetical protein